MPGNRGGPLRCLSKDKEQSDPNLSFVYSRNPGGSIEGPIILAHPSSRFGRPSDDVLFRPD